MYFKKGDTRNVLAFPDLGFVIKLPRIYWSNALDLIRSARTRHQMHKLGKEYALSFKEFLREQLFERTSEHSWCLKSALGAGVMSNWRERVFYKISDPSIRLLLQPTYFSLFGFFNIQKYGKPADIEEDSEPIYHAFYPIAGSDLIRDGHHWFNGSNFHLAVDGPKLLDYGNTKTQWIVEKYGVDLYVRFDLTVGRSQTEKFRRAHQEKIEKSPQTSSL